MSTTPPTIHITRGVPYAQTWNFSEVLGVDSPAEIFLVITKYHDSPQRTEVPCTQEAGLVSAALVGIDTDALQSGAHFYRIEAREPGALTVLEYGKVVVIPT